MKWQLDKEYMRNHILSYVEFQLSQGYGLGDVKAVLLRYGYESDLVEEICSSINPGKYTHRKKTGNKELDEDLYFYIQNLLVDYIKKEQSQGYTLEVIEKALVNFGHHPKMVRKAIRAVRDGSVTDLQPVFKFPPGLMFLISLAGIVLFIMYMTFTTDAQLYVVFLSFLPALAMVLIVFAVILNTGNKRLVQMLPIVSVGGVVLLFLGILEISPVARQLSEPGTILIINVFLGFIGASLMSLFSRLQPKRVSVEEIIDSVPAPLPEQKQPKKERLKLKKA